MNVEIITIGDELLSGHTVNTNAAYIGQQLTHNNFSIFRSKTIRDSNREILVALNDGFRDADILILTGGLGPTKDDITKKTLARFFNSPFVVHDESLALLTSFLSRRDIKVTEINKMQALVPKCCSVLVNEMGTAPGMLFEHNNKILISLPGVPHEMRNLLDTKVIPLLNNRYSVGHQFIKTLLVTGIPESHLSDLLEEFELSLPKEYKLAYLPSAGIIKLRLLARYSSKEEGESIFSNYLLKLKDNLVGYLIPGAEVTLEEHVVKSLINSGKTISFAESCTGGNLSAAITAIAGCSEIFKGGVVSYSNEAKISILGVSPKSIEKHGAVSEEVAKEMAIGALSVFKSDFSISTTGIAGPTGGTEDKPVGTVWICIASREKVIAKKYVFGLDRANNIRRSVLNSLSDFRKMM